MMLRALSNGYSQIAAVFPLDASAVRMVRRAYEQRKASPAECVQYGCQHAIGEIDAVTIIDRQDPVELQLT